MKSVNIFSTAVSASARSWHQPIIIWKVHSWKGKKNWFGASRCTGMKGTKLRFKTRAATSRQSTENCNTQFPSCRCHCPAFSSAISIIQMGGNYCNKYWRAGVWEWLRWVLMGHWAGTCELLRNKGLGAQCAVQTVWEWGWGSPVHAGKVRWWDNPLWAFPATAGTALFGNCAQLLFFSWRNQKIREDLNCTEIGLAPPGLSFPDAATPWHGGCAGAGALHIHRRQRPGFHIQWPRAPHLAAGKQESSCPWAQKTSPKWCLLILSVSKKPFKWNAQK